MDSSAQIGGSGSIQGTVLDTSDAGVPGATVTATNLATGIDTIRRTTDAGVVRGDAAATGPVSRDGHARRLPDVRPGRHHRRWARRGGPQRHAPGRRYRTGGGGHRRSAVARDRRRQAWPDDSQRNVHRSSAGDEHRRAPRSDRVHVLDARRAVDRTLGQRHGRPGFHHRHVRGRHPDHQRRGPGRRAQHAVRDFGGRGQSIPGRDQRHRRDVQRSGRVQLRRQVRNQHVPWRRVRVLPQQGARREGLFPAVKPDDNQHEYGGTLGGPIRKNRMFFFAAYDGYRDRRQTASVLTSIPTLGAAQRRFQRAAGDDLRSANDPSESQRHRVCTRSFSQQHHPAGADLAHLAIIPVVPARSDQRAGCRTTTSAGRCRSASTTTTSRGKSISS